MLFLIGNAPVLPSLFFSRLRFSVTPEINAVSVVIMAGTVIFDGLALGLGQLRGEGGGGGGSGGGSQ